MHWTNELTSLQDALAHLYSGNGEIIRVVNMSGLDRSYIALEGRAIDTWHSVLLEAEKHDRVPELIEVVRSDYPESSALATAVDAYLEAYGAPSRSGSEHGNGRASVAPTPPGAPMSALPSGTVAFLFTDIEGSTRLWEQFPQAMANAVARHDALMRGVIDERRGHVFKTVGDAFNAVFETTSEALEAAIDAQRRLSEEPWGATGPIRVRMALHTGSAEERDADYFGSTLNRLARLLSTGHGGQILLSSAARALVVTAPPGNAQLIDLGEHRLKDLARAEHIYQVVVPDLPSEFPPLKSLDNSRQNLPAQLTPFIGRAQQLRDILDLLLDDQARLVTLTGPGGIGKTRLALQIAAEASDAFADGVWWVPLAAINESAAVWTSVAATLDIHERGDEPMIATLKRHLKDARLLLLLDNFEQVLDAAPMVAELLLACPGLRILVTSREALMISGEHIYVVPTMALPPKSLRGATDLGHYEGIQLFLARAGEKRHDFTLTAENAATIAEICRQADGLPLGIELAAARVGYFPSLGDLQTRLTKRLPELKRRARDLPERLRTMRASIAWSYDLLDEADRALFRRLAVFASGFTLDAAGAVSAETGTDTVDVMEGLESLVDKSLVQPEESAVGMRYRMLETIREYGVEQLAARGEEPEVRSAHANYYLALAERARHQLAGEQEGVALDRLEVEHANLRAALAWTIDQPDVELPLRLASSLRPFWQIRGFLQEGHQWLERALANGRSAPPAIRAAALVDLGRLTFDLGDYARAPQCFEESLDIRRELGDKPGVVQSLINLGMAVAARGQLERARSLREEAFAISHELGDALSAADSLYRLGDSALEEGDHARARELYSESLETMQRQGQEDRQRVANLHLMLGITDRLDGNGTAAIEAAGTAMGIFRAIGDRMGIANAHLEVGHAARLLGDDERAEQSFVEALTSFREAGSEPGIVEALEGLACIAAARGRPQRAATLVGAASTWRSHLEHPFVPPADSIVQERLVDEARRTQVAAFSRGKAMSLEQVIEVGLANRVFPGSS